MLAVLVLALALYGHVASHAGRYAGLGSGLVKDPSVAQLLMLQTCSPASHSHCQRGHVPAVRSAMGTMKGPRPPPWTGQRPMRPRRAFKADRITREQTMQYAALHGMTNEAASRAYFMTLCQFDTVCGFLHDLCFDEASSESFTAVEDTYDAYKYFCEFEKPLPREQFISAMIEMGHAVSIQNVAVECISQSPYREEEISTGVGISVPDLPVLCFSGIVLTHRGRGACFVMKMLEDRPASYTIRQKITDADRELIYEEERFIAEEHDYYR